MSIVFTSAWENITSNQRFSKIMVIGIALCTFICGAITMIVLGQALEPRAIRTSVNMRTLHVGYAYLPTNSPLASVDRLTFKLPNTKEEIAKLKFEVSGIESAFLEEQQREVTFADSEHRYSITGAFSYVLGDYVTGKDLIITEGRSPRLQNETITQEIMIHQQLAKSLQLGLSETIQLDNQIFRIVGLFESRDNVSLHGIYSHSEGNSGRRILAYLAGDEYFYDRKLSTFTTLSIVPEAGDVDTVVSYLEKRIEEGVFGYATIKTNVPWERLFPGSQVTKAILTWVVYAGCIVIGSVLVIMNIQLNRIRELIREIALMKAIGVKITRVMAIITVQYGLLSIAGCLIGSSLVLVLFGTVPQQLKPFMNEISIFMWVSTLFVVFFTVVIGVIPTLYCLKTDVTLYRANRD